MRVRYIGETDPCSLIHGKIYDCLGEENGCYRVIDEEGVDDDEITQGYLYSKELFDIVR